MAEKELNDPPCPLCGFKETVHAEYPDPKGDAAFFVCMVCGHKFWDNLYGNPRRPTPELKPWKSKILLLNICGEG